MVAIVALAGCSADGVHSVQNFFPGSEKTSWDECGKFSVTGSEIIVCASTSVLPGATQQTYNIEFSLPHAAHVRIAVFDAHAARMKMLLDSDEAATLPGFFRQPPVPWDFTDESGHRVKAGNYRIYFESETFISTADLEVE
ncbi:MAG: hypothetical protein ACRENN_00835 [Candidatus Eiseniibacteriota bacterium]